MNKVLLVGRIVQKPELRETPNSNIPYTRFRVAVRRENSSQNNKEESDFIPLVAWRNTATYITNYLNIGDLVSIEGSFNATSYKNANDEYVNVYEVLISSIRTLEGRKVREERNGTQSSNNFSSTKKPFKNNASEPTFVENKNSSTNDISEEEDEVDWDLEF